MTKNNKVRRKFLKELGVLGLASTALSSCMSREGSKSAASTGPVILDGQSYSWNMVTTWPPNFPILGEGCKLMAKWVEEMSAGRLKIKVFGGGELIPALETFDAVSSGTAQIGNGAAYYWAGKVRASQFFAAVPFGMNAQQVNTWLLAGGGQELWEELYAPFNLMPMPAGNTGVQMAGWFNREINSMEDLKGLKMRMPGLGGKVLAKAGGTAVLSPGSEIYTNLERGVIDATEWIGPYHDYIMGFHQIAEHYYSPGWHEPGTVLETIVNKNYYEQLPQDLQAILKAAIHRQNIWTLSQFESKNAEYLKKLNDEGIYTKRIPQDVINQLRIIAEEVVREEASKDAQSQKVFKAYKDFRTKMNNWTSVSEKRFFDSLMS